jgi:hypothetical protein
MKFVRYTSKKEIRITKEDLDHKKIKIITKTNAQVSKKFSINKLYVLLILSD